MPREEIIAQLERVTESIEINREVEYERGREVMEEMFKVQSEILPCGCIIDENGSVVPCSTMVQIIQRIKSTWRLSEWREHDTWLRTRLQHLQLPDSEKHNWQS